MGVDLIYSAIFWGSTLILLSIFAGLLSKKVGMPILLTYIMLGMLAGEDGFGRIEFHNFEAAFLLGNLALAIIIFEGGLCTKAKTLKQNLWPSFTLATLGVLITAGITGVAAFGILGLTWKEGLLIGAIVGSTDAAAVFSLLRDLGFDLQRRVKETLEIESGINDPMAIFLTILLVNLISQDQPADILQILGIFFQQMGLGLAMGLIGGHSLCWLLEKMKLPYSFYPLLALSGAVSIFGLTNIWGGSGFLAIYIVGVLISMHRSINQKHTIQQFHEGLAWLCQIGMFLMLGLLVSPSALIPIALLAFVVSLIVIFVARPIATFICLACFKYNTKEKVFISWVGLKGAVPIILAVFPLLAGLEHTTLYFEVAFFVVLISLLLQGATISPLANRFDLVEKQNNDKS